MRFRHSQEIQAGVESRRGEGRREREEGSEGRREGRREGGRAPEGSSTSAAAREEGGGRGSVSSALLTHFQDDVTLTEMFTWRGEGEAGSI